MNARKVLGAVIAATAFAAGMAPAAHGATFGETAACAGDGPAVRVNVSGLKDRIGELKLELYPFNEADFLRDDNALLREGKVFRRVRVPTPPTGAVALCMRVPAPGVYALVFSHNRDGKNKFNFWEDGVGMPGNAKLGRSRPRLAMARIAVPASVLTIDIQAQYLRGFSGFGPLKTKV